MDEASAVETPAADVSAVVDPGQDAKAPVAATITSERRAGRRGLLTSRKRIALTIDAELTSETGQQKESETRDGESSTPGSASNSDATHSGASAAGTGGDNDDEAVPWWILEYRCPPPGHLGAHDVPVAVKESEQLDAELNSSLETEEKQDGEAAPKQQQQHSVFGRRLMVKPATDFDPEQQTESARDLRQRKQHSIESIDYSPSQKRKLVHVHEHDPSELSPSVVAKELKRFHEPSDGVNELSAEQKKPPPPELTSVVTPSNLVRPLNKIDIHCQRTAPSAATASESAAKSASHASKSA